MLALAIIVVGLFVLTGVLLMAYALCKVSAAADAHLRIIDSHEWEDD